MGFSSALVLSPEVQSPGHLSLEKNEHFTVVDGEEDACADLRCMDSSAYLLLCFGSCCGNAV